MKRMNTETVSNNDEVQTPPVKISSEQVSGSVEELKDLSKNFNSDLEVLEDKHVSKQKKKGNKGPILCLIILVFLFALGYFGYNEYKKFTKDPTDAFKAVIENAYKNFSEGLKPYKTTNKSEFNLLKDSVVISGGLSFKSAEMPDLEKEKINILLGLDYDKKLAQLGVDLSRDKEKLIDAEAYFKNDNMYMKSSTLFDNVYSQEGYKFDEAFDLSSLEDVMNNKTIDVDDIDFIVRGLKDVLIASLDKNSMTNTKETITISGESIEVNKIAYKLDKESCKKLFISIASKMSEDDDLIKKISSLIGQSESAIEDALDEAKSEEYYDNMEGFDNGEFVIYTKGINYELVKFEFVLDENSITGLFKDKESSFSFEMDSDSYELIICEKNPGYEIEFKEGNTSFLNLNIKEWKKDLIDIDYGIKYADVNLDGRVKLKVDSSSSNKKKGVLEFNVSGMVEEEKIEADIAVDFEVTFKDKVCPDDVSSAINSNEMTEEDKLKMSQKLMELEDSSILKYFGELFGSNNPSNGLMPGYDM